MKDSQINGPKPEEEYVTICRDCNFNISDVPEKGSISAGCNDRCIAGKEKEERTYNYVINEWKLESLPYCSGINKKGKCLEFSIKKHSA